jgi:hypothetical protein
VPSRSVLILCLDSYGDLTLREPLFRSLLEGGNRVTRGCSRSWTPVSTPWSPT